MPKPKGDLIPTRGAIPDQLHMEVLRELTPEDLANLSSAPKVGVPVIQRIRAIHHKQAALLAEGKTVAEVAAIVGCTPQRLVQLQNDPAFQELLAHYQDQIITQMLTDAARIQDKITDLTELAVDEMLDRLEDPDRRQRLPIGEIRKIAEFGADRTVAPPRAASPASSPPAAITINFGTSLKPPPELDDKTIEGKAEPSADAGDK